MEFWILLCCVEDFQRIFEKEELRELGIWRRSDCSSLEEQFVEELEGVVVVVSVVAVLCFFFRNSRGGEFRCVVCIFRIDCV